jgi:hypothetical protein
MSSDSDWSLGVLVFALVALHLSSIADFASSEPITLFDEAKLAIKIESDEQFRVALSELAERLKVDRFELAKRIYSLPSLEVGCNETSIEMLLLKFTYLQDLSDQGLKIQLGRCFTELNSQIQLELNSFSNYTLQNLESVKDENRRQHCTFNHIDTAISMLNTVANYFDFIGVRYLSACKEMTDKFARLKPVLANSGRDAIRFSKGENNIALYRFCHQLIDGQPGDDSSIFADGSVRQFLNILDDQRLALESASFSEKRQWVAMAVVQVARKNELKHVPLDENILNDVRRVCKSAVDRAWFLKVKSLAGLSVNTDGQPSEEHKRYLRDMEACDILTGMDKETILRKAIEKKDAERQSDAKKSKPVAKRRCNWSIMGCFNS